MLVVAASQGNRVIGKSNNEIPWPRIPGDMQNFRKETIGFPVIMGRITFETLSKNSETGLPKPLPKRLNIIVTRNPEYKVSEGVLIASSIEKAIELAKESSPEKICIIGGEQIYTLGLPLADEISYTEIKLIVSGDTYFPKIPSCFKKASCQPCLEDIIFPDGKTKVLRYEIQKWYRSKNNE